MLRSAYLRLLCLCLRRQALAIYGTLLRASRAEARAARVCTILPTSSVIARQTAVSTQSGQSAFIAISPWGGREAWVPLWDLV